MKITGLMPARNEDWILGFSLRAYLMWVDEVILLLHSCTDHTREIADAIQHEVGSDRLVILENPDLVWRDLDQRQFLLERGRNHGSEHFAILDADEVITGDLMPKVRQAILDLEPGYCMAAPWISVWKSPFRYRVNPTVVTHSTIAFRDAPLLHWRSDRGYDQHHRNPYEAIYIPNPDFVGGTMHFQFTDWRRIVAKHALYKMNEAWRWPGRKTPQEVNQQYDATLSEKNVQLAPTPFEWFAPYVELMKHLHLGEEPWQEAECRRLWNEHGPGRFAGLDLYGIVGPPFNRTVSRVPQVPVAASNQGSPAPDDGGDRNPRRLELVRRSMERQALRSVRVATRRGR